LKELKEILKNVITGKIHGNENISVNEICFDSRIVKNNDLFIAVKGTQVDGHEYIQKAVDNGAVSVVCETLPDNLSGNITYVQVDDSAEALGKMASAYYDDPSRKLKLVGITGTNGKTTIATLLYRLFRRSGFKAGLVSTINNYINDKVAEARYTTPDAVQLNGMLKDMVDDGCEFCFMEVSSHAIKQKRISGIDYYGGVFTNLTHDHLDYHPTFDDYLTSKKMFFDDLPDRSFALTNNDDPNGKVMIQNTKAGTHFYALKSMADFKCRILENSINGMLLNIDGTEVWTKYIGEFNAYNLLAVYGCAVLSGLEKDSVLTMISDLDVVSGRFENIRSADGITAIIDYAHTPDALDNVLQTINKINQGNGHVITVVGAGGNRDRAKRPVMADVAVKNSEKVILTSDNPRNEKPEDIIEEMKQGIQKEYENKVLCVVDRKEAIRAACMMASDGDIILVAGKGHEDYQEINGVRHHFDDKEVVKEIFKEKE